MCRHFMEDYGIEVRIADIITFMVHLELMTGERKVAIMQKSCKRQKNNADKIEIWGDGKQTRSFYISTIVLKEHKII